MTAVRGCKYFSYIEENTLAESLDAITALWSTSRQKRESFLTTLIGVKSYVIYLLT